MFYYSPHTGELIKTSTPAEWMGQTENVPPEYDKQTQGCFFRGEQWEIVDQQPEAVPIPARVSMGQARIALLEAGLLGSVGAALASIADPIARQKAQIAWEYAQEVGRNSPLVQTLSVELNLTDAQLDALFINASEITL